MSDGGFCHYCQKVNCVCSSVIPPHEHNFVPPSNDDAQQCDTYCREHWHRCSICGLSRDQINKTEVKK